MAPKKLFTAARLLERKREAEKKRREKRRNDPKLKALDQELRRKRHGERKRLGLEQSVTEMSSRKQRALRKKWRESSKKHYYKVKALSRIEPVPSAQPSPTGLEHTEKTSSHPGSDRRKAGRKTVNRYKSKVYNDLKKEKKKVAALQKRYTKYKQRYYRVLLKDKKNTFVSPRTKVNRMISDSTPAGTQQVKRRLLFGEVLETELRSSIDSHDRKKMFVKLLKGDCLKKYRALSVMGEFFTYKRYRSNLKRNITNRKCEQLLKKRSILIQSAVHKFLRNDENSRVCPGKKDFVKGKHKVHQKRYLNDTLKNLHKKYNLKTDTPKISYTTFCRMKPVYIVKASHSARDTCLCLKHENFELLLNKLWFLKVVPHKSISAMIESVCCENSNEKCLSRKCSSCKNINFQINQFDGATETMYSEWRTITEERLIKGQKKLIKRTVKIAVHCNIKTAVDKLINDFVDVMQHVYRIRHQQHAFTSLKKRPNELSIHMDFSENYACKNAAEPQSVHFGASRQQLSLHTVVAWCNTEKNSLCTVSENLRHDAKAILAHLNPILVLLLGKYPTVETVHFLSDGPTTQYRNRTMFTILGKTLPKLFPQVKNISWNFSEAGHGKGPVDGVGGVLKRTADRLVAENKDVSNISQFVDQLRANIERVSIIVVTESEMTAMDEVISQERLIPAIKGTMKTHQVTFNTTLKSLNFNSLSCLRCTPGSFCPHYSMGNSYSILEDLEEERSASAGASRKGGPKTISRRGRPSASAQPVFTPRINEGDWIAAVYSEEWYPGIVEDILLNESITVNFMSRSGQNQLFFWPPKPDRQLLTPEGVLYVLKIPPVPVTTRLSKVKEYKYIEYLKNNLID